MTNKIKTTAPVSSVGADGEQPIMKNHTEIIANETAQINLQATVFRGFDTNCPEKSGQGGGLQTVSMTELYDTVYPPRTPVVDGFLYGGTYLFVGAPKVGKSFFMGQLAYHVAMGIPLWNYPVRKGTVSVDLPQSVKRRSGSASFSYKILLTLIWTLKPLRSFMRMMLRTD